MQSNKKVPIERLNKFFSQDDFDLEIDFGREWLEGDINIKVILYRVDRENTTIVSFNMATPANKSYNTDGSMRYLEYGTLTLGVYQEQLDDLGVDINYGDFIGYPESETNIKYFTVSNNGKIFSDNAHTIGGFKGLYRTITCVPTDLDEFNGK